jgi:hypothetical protein
VNEIFTRAFGAGLIVAMVALIAYQIFMLYWTKKTVGSVPMAVKILRGVNLVLLVAGTVLIILGMARA